MRKIIVSVAGLLAAGGGAFGGDLPRTPLSLNPAMLTADDAGASDGLLMEGLEKAGAGKTLGDAKLRIDGWIETGYTYDHRHSSASSGTVIIPGPFTHEFGNHVMLNQVVLRFSRDVATDKFDIGGALELMYGSDAARIHATGLGYNGSDPTDDNSPADDLAFNNLHPILQFDIPDAYITLNFPVGNGLQLMIGKWDTLLGYEHIEAPLNAFYSHSYLFSQVPGTQTGMIASYRVDDKLQLQFGFSRGWDIALEDTNGAIDALGQVAYSFSKEFEGVLTFNVGPENAGDTSHYRTSINPIFHWQATEKLSFAVEGLYVYDGGYNGNIPGFSDGRTHAYGDVWGAALYASYAVNDMFTVNARFEDVHGFLGTFAGVDLQNAFGVVPAVNAFEITLGTTITPFPKDQYFKGLMLRPEIRYDFTDSSAFPFYAANGTTYKDQLTFAADVIFRF